MIPFALALLGAWLFAHFIAAAIFIVGARGDS